MTTEISEARRLLHEQLTYYLADVLDGDRVHLYAPTILALPCVWIGQPGVTAQVMGSPGAKVRLVRFGVYTLADGYDPVQCALLDELVARVWDAAQALPKADGITSVPQGVDIGGVTQRGVVTDVVVTTFATTMCLKPPPAVPRPRPAVPALA